MVMNPIQVRLRELRDARGWSQTELAERAGVTRATVSRIEGAKVASLDLQVFEKLARALDVHPSALVDWAETGVPFTHCGEHYVIEDSTGGVASVGTGKQARPSNAQWTVWMCDNEGRRMGTVITLEAEPQDDADHGYLIDRVKARLDDIPRRQSVSRDRLIELLNEELACHGEWPDCRIKGPIYALRKPDATGCNWSDTLQLRRSGTHLWPPVEVMARVITSVRARYNLAD